MPLKTASNSKLRDYAFDPNTFTAELSHTNRDGSKVWRTAMKTVWCRRTKGILVATTGTMLSLHRQDGRPDMEQFFADWHSRIGPDWLVSWDGELSRVARTMDEAIIEAAVTELSLVLNAYPAPPPGYTSWYRPAENEPSPCTS